MPNPVRVRPRNHNVPRRRRTSVQYNTITVRSSTARIDAWLKEREGYITEKIAGHPNASKWAVNESLTRALATLANDPDNWYHQRFVAKLIDPNEATFKHLTPANRAMLLELAITTGEWYYKHFVTSINVKSAAFKKLSPEKRSQLLVSAALV